MKTLQPKKNKWLIAIVEEDFSTRELLTAVITHSFADIQACSYSSIENMIKSNPFQTYKIDSAVVSLKAFHEIQSCLSPETKDILKVTPTVLMASSLTKTDLDSLNAFFTTEPIVLKKPFAVQDILNLVEWTTSKEKKDFSTRLSKSLYKKKQPVLC